MPDLADSALYVSWVRRAAEAERSGHVRTPNLGASLDVVRTMPQTRDLLRSLPQRPLCLIEGYVCPGNAAALRRFMRESGAGSVRVHAVDVHDLPAAYAKCGLRPPQMRFTRASATDLGAIYRSRSVALVVQDFLLNCAPPAQHAAILSEVARMLAPDGVAIISYTDRSGLEDSAWLAADAFQHVAGGPWRRDAACLADVIGAEEACCRIAEFLVRPVVRDDGNGTWTLITWPDGRFEHFVSAAAALALIRNAGLALISEVVSTGVDDNGLACVRHRYLLRRAGVRHAA